MDREYLEDYEQKEKAEYEKLLKSIREGKFNFEKDKYPPNERFCKLEEPVAVTSSETIHIDTIWAQIPFSGSLLLNLPPFPKPDFEKLVCKVSEIPEIIKFVKETGRLQVMLSAPPITYEGLDHLDLFFKELNPPIYAATPSYVFGNAKEVQKIKNEFYTLGRIRYFNFLRNQSQQVSSRSLFVLLIKNLMTYETLKLAHYTIVEDIENLMIDDPEKALHLLSLCLSFIIEPIRNLRSTMTNFSLQRAKASQALPLVYQPQEIRLPCEIGKFLLRKLTYAAQDMRACYYLMDNYDAYDLQKVQQSLNEAIVTNHPDIVNKSAEDLSEILDNVWSDKTIPRRVKDLQIGVPFFMAAIGAVAAGPIGATGGFLAGLGYNLVEKTIDLNTEGLSERLAKLKTKSYQANVYDFKKKYKHRIVREELLNMCLVLVQ